MKKKDEKELLAELLNQSIPGGTAWYSQKRYLNLETEQEVRTILPELAKSVALLNYILYQTATDEEIYDTFQSNKLIETLDNIASGLRLTRRTLAMTGLDNMIRQHIAVIIDLMRIEHFPKEDLELLQNIGHRNPRAALAAIIQLCKTHRVQLANLLTEMGPMGSLETIEGLIYEQKNRIPSTPDRPMTRTRVEHRQPRPPRRLYKGLGQVGGGVLMALGNITLLLWKLRDPIFLIG